MFKMLRGLFSNDLSIDLGTANTLIYVSGKGIVLNEPSVVAIRMADGSRNEKSVVAVGADAKLMLGRTPGHIEAIRPLKDGVIADFTITEKMLQHFIKKVHGNSLFKPSPRVLVCVPCGSTQVERRAIKESAQGAGAREVYLVEEPMAAGIGAGMPIVEPTASMIVDIGGGTTEVAIMSLGDIATCESVRVAGDDLDEAIINYMKKNYNLTVGEQTAERIKIEVGSAAPQENETTVDVRGRDNITGLPRKTTVTSEEIRESMNEPIQAIIDVVTRTLERAEPELAADLVDNGITIAGGGALLRGIDVVLSNATGLDVTIAEDPLTCVARGTSIYLDNLELWKSVLESDMDD